MSKPFRDKNIDVPENIIKNLLTASEVRMLKNRWLIINLLKEGLPIRQIAEKIGVGTDTVVRVSKMFKGFKKVENPKTKTSWIFGKTE